MWSKAPIVVWTSEAGFRVEEFLWKSQIVLTKIKRPGLKRRHTESTSHASKRSMYLFKRKR